MRHLDFLSPLSSVPCLFLTSFSDAVFENGGRHVDTPLSHVTPVLPSSSGKKLTDRFDRSGGLGGSVSSRG